MPNVPADIFDLQSFDHENGLLSTERLKTTGLNIWVGKLTEPDLTVPGRSWSLEVTISEHSKEVHFGSRLSCFSRHLDFDFEPAVPRLYKELAASGILYGDGVRLVRTPIDIQTDDDVEWLVALINNKRRWRNIIALASDDRGICAINPNILSDRVCAVGHVVTIFPYAAFRLSDTIGKFHSVFDQGIRIYRPTIQVDVDKRSTHPLFIKSQLERLDLKRLQISITLDAFRASVERNVLKQTVPTFVQIRSANATFRLIQAQESGSTIKVQLQAAITAKVAAEAQATEALALAVQEENARMAAEDERNQEKARSIAMYARVQSLEEQLKAAAIQETEQDQPTTYEEIPFWGRIKFSGPDASSRSGAARAKGRKVRRYRFSL